jgi:hypothetical protein
MSSALKRVHSATGTVALVLALLALVASAAGVGYAAGQIGTNDIKNNAVTAKKIKKNAVTAKKIKKNAVTGVKVKDGALTAADLVAAEKQMAAALANGGEGDCIWQGGAALLPGLGTPAFRKDRFGTVHLSGVAIMSDGPGGDASCDNSDPGQFSDSVVFTLPAGYVPAYSFIVSNGTESLIVAGASGISSGGQTLLPGQVGATTTLGVPVVLDGISFEPVGSSVVLPRQGARAGGQLDVLDLLGAR